MSVRRLPPLPTIGDILRVYKLRARKQLSQNFLLDMNLCQKLVKVAGNLDGCHVCEVGPGPGGITRALLERDVEKLSVVELDRRFLPGLEILASCSDGRMNIHQGDVLHFDLHHIFSSNVTVPWENGLPRIHLIGNLPFSVSTALIIKWLRCISERTGAWQHGRTPLTLTFQKEVAERMVAAVNTDQRSRLSIMCQYLCDVQLKFIIPGSAFVPPPKVDVGVVRFVPLKVPKIDVPFDIVEKVVRHVFHYRNKKCIRGVETLFPPTRQDLISQMFERVSIPEELQSYKISMDDFELFCKAYHDIIAENPDIKDFDYRSREGLKLWRQRKKLSRSEDLDDLITLEPNH